MRSDRMRAISVAITDGGTNSAGGAGRAAALAVDIAAIGDDRLAGHVGRRVGHQEQRHLGDFLRASPAAQGNPRQPAVATAPALSQAAADWSRAALDAAAAEPLRQEWDGLQRDLQALAGHVVSSLPAAGAWTPPG